MADMWIHSELVTIVKAGCVGLSSLLATAHVEGDILLWVAHVDYEHV